MMIIIGNKICGETLKSCCPGAIIYLFYAFVRRSSIIKKVLKNFAEAVSQRRSVKRCS